MKISIALCTYNGQTYIKEQIESLLKQTRQPNEIIICDDCSKDNTVEISKMILQSWPGEWQVCQNKNNLGFRKNFQKAISLCTGDVIFLCDQDDVWHPKKIELMSRIFAEDPQVLLAFHDAELVDAKLHMLKSSFWEELNFNPEEFCEGNYSRLLKGNVIQGAACAFRRALFLSSQPFLEFAIHDEWLGLNAALQGKIVPVPQTLLKYRQTGANAIGADGRKSWAKKVIDWTSSFRKMLSQNLQDLKRQRVMWKILADKYPEHVIGNITADEFFMFLDKRETSIIEKRPFTLPSLRVYQRIYNDTGKAFKLYVKDRLSFCL